MPISSFRLKSTLGRNYTTNFDDTLRTKVALRDLQYYETPPYGMTGYPDEPLFSAIEKFQNDHGLRRDGIMKPGGETAAALGERLIRANYAGDRDQTQNPTENGTSDNQIAQTLELPMPGAAGTAIGGAIVGGAIGRDILRRSMKNGDRQNMDMIDPLPPLPPEPNKPPKIENKEELPATPPEIPTLEGRPLNEVLKNDPMIFEALKDEVIKEFSRPLQANPGDATTQEGNAITVNDILPKVIALWGPAKAALMKHVGGARDKAGIRKPEIHLKNIETQGRAGSSDADITIKIDEETHHFNTGKTLKDGRTGIAPERYSFGNLGKNAGSDAAGFLPKLRPGMDRAEWYERTYKMAVEHFTKHWGPPLE